MKTVRAIIIGIVCVAVICGLFFLVTKKGKEPEKEVSEVSDKQVVLTQDLDSKYPSTPREVIKFYHKIINCYYNDTYTDDELEKMAEQALKMFDPDLKKENSLGKYVAKIKLEVKDYKDNSRSVSQFWVCDTNDVKFVTDTEKGDELAYVRTSYFIIERGSGNCSKTFQEYVLRKDENGRWKIRGFYKVEGTK